MKMLHIIVKKGQNIIVIDMKKMIKALASGYLFTLIMLVVFTYLMKKFTWEERIINIIIIGIYAVGAFLGGMYEGWMKGSRRVAWGAVYGMLYIVILVAAASLINRGIPYKSYELAGIILCSAISGAAGGFFSP